jgi:hypothetical protein
MKRIVFPLLIIVTLAACTGSATVTVPTVATSNGTVTQTRIPTETASVGIVPTTDEVSMPTLSPQEWQSIPVVPTLSDAMLAVYRRGLESGRDPARFSKIGDCQNINPYFLTPFDDSTKYRLGDQYAYLQSTIDHFSGSWSRQSAATHGGFNAATVLSPFWIVPKPADCNEGETPSACELRVYNASFAVISMEEDWSGDLGKFDRYTRLLVEYVLSRNVVPILGTRAEWPDAEIRLNAITVQIAQDYDLPLWNFGAATLLLPDYGLSADGFHLTPGTIERDFYFDDPARMELGWVWRNLTALQAIDAVYNGVTIQP